MYKAMLFATVSMLFVSSQAFAQDDYLLSSHILDVGSGFPAPDVRITLKKLSPEKKWVTLDTKVTDKNGRVREFLKQEPGKDLKGVYKLRFHVAPYFQRQKVDYFYPFIDVVFEIKDGKHYHVPLTLSRYGYSTYRGS